MSVTTNKIRVADYLALRLEQLGFQKFFSVPGNHLGPFISSMDQTTEIRWNGSTLRAGTSRKTLSVIRDPN